MKIEGVYRGVVVSIDDPQSQQRLLLKVPALFGPDAVTDWAFPSTMPGARIVPKIGEPVWVSFEGGDEDRPVWSGMWNTKGGPSGTLSIPFQIYVGVEPAAVLPPDPGLSFPSTTIQETAPGVTTVNAVTFTTTGAVTTGGPLTAPSAAVTGSAVVGGNFNVVGTTVLAGLAAGATTLGATTLGATTINGNAQINGTLTATTITGMPTVDTTSADISASAPGDTKVAGVLTTRFAPADHKHGRELWGTVGQITTSKPQDSGLAGAQGATCDAGHRHPRTLKESVFLGRFSTPGQAGGLFVAAATNYFSVPLPTGISWPVFTKNVGTATNLIIDWKVSGFIGGASAVQGFQNPYISGSTLFRVQVVLAGGGTTNDGAFPFAYNISLCHLAFGSTQNIAGLAAGAYTVSLQCNTLNHNAGFDWYWNDGDAITLVAWEA